MAYPALQVDYDNPIGATERAGIDRVCLTFRDNTQVLRERQCNQVTVYRGGTWWHPSPNDQREHVTVRYNRFPARRCHIYRNGTGTIRPAAARQRAANANDDPDNSDWSVEFSGREDV